MITAVNSNQFLIGSRGQPATLDFTLPPELEASAPAEVRGTGRDDVRMLVSHMAGDRLVNTHFRTLPCWLNSGDLLVINTSGTLNAALPARRSDGSTIKLHLSTHRGGELWTVELRRLTGEGTTPLCEAEAGETLELPAAGSARLLAPHDGHAGRSGQTRLWLATLRLPGPIEEYLSEHGSPIRYRYVNNDWPTAHYQTVYVTEMGSAEMPSAGRAFTPELITRLVAQGVGVAPLVLHTGVGSLEQHESPYEEYYRVPLETVHRVNAARAHGKRVIAVGTTVVRALETVTDEEGKTHPGEGWTKLVVGPGYHLRAATGLLTGWHEPHSTHLAMLAALTGLDHLRLAYAEALAQGYLWHEFGDLHLIL